jgi:hypothetical protein
MISRCLTLACSISLFFAGLASSQDEKKTWRYTPDALEKLEKIPNDAWQVYTPKKIGEFPSKMFLAPTTPSRYVVMLTQGAAPQRLDLVSRKALPPLDVPSHLDAAVSPDGNFYLVLDAQATARVWSFQTGKQVMSYKVKDGESLDFADFGPPGKLILSVREKLPKNPKVPTDRHIEIRNIEKNGELEKSFARTRYGVENELPVYALSANRKSLALPFVSKGRFGFRLDDLAAGEALGTTELTAKGPPSVRGAGISPDGTKLASFHISAGNQQKVLVWDLKTGEFITNANSAGAALAPSLRLRQMFWLGDSKHIYVLGGMVVNALNNKTVYRYNDPAVKDASFLGPVNSTDLLLWNRTKGDALQLVTPKLEK